MNKLEPENIYIYKLPDRNAIVRKVALALVLAIFSSTLLIAYFYTYLKNSSPSSSIAGISIQKFTSASEFNNYFSSASEITISPEPVRDFAAISGEVSLQATPERVSQTNVQVAGIDEPDIVKTDGENIYFSKGVTYITPLRDLQANISMPVPPVNMGSIQIIKATPVEDIKELAAIAEQGDLLLDGNTLVVFTSSKIIGYDVRDPANPIKSWDINLDPNVMVSARLENGKIYLITRNSISPGSPCLIPLLYQNGKEVSISCTEIYRPNIIIPSDVTFNALRVDSASGDIEDKISFVGSSSQSVVYVSENAIYATYTYQKDYAQLFNNFFLEEGSGLLPLELVTKIQKLSGYDIGAQSKFTEVQAILEQYKATLASDDRLKFENDLQNKLSEYVEKHKREIELTGIVKIDKDGEFSLDSNSEVPGHLLNQFSLDEYQGNLRIATTIGSSILSLSNPVNDIYVLNDKLKAVGSLTGLSEDERIYSARFIGDKAYLVTFRETDPFFVIDLSDPKNPKTKGELKIPGYSSYLHPIDENKILGIGKENQYVKITLFDVSDPQNPLELSKYLLSEYWSDVLNTHKAFLLDSKYNVFFMPGGQSGYVFSYSDGTLNIKRVVADISAKRALFINNFLYILGDQKIVVLNEENWENVGELELGS
jgi:inhibitor of cysteine peptidase